MCFFLASLQCLLGWRGKMEMVEVNGEVKESMRRLTTTTTTNFHRHSRPALAKTRGDCIEREN